MPTEKMRYTITVDDELYKLIEDFRFTHRYETKSDATSALLKLGVEAALQQMQEENKK